MLYRSTRNKLDSFTAYRALRINNAADGGFILPLRIPVIENAKLEEMQNADFLQNVADLLNIFFSTAFTAWDVESTIGKTPLQMTQCGQKIVLVQCWKNPTAKMEYFLQSLFNRVCSDKGIPPTVWARVAIRIALIAATVLHCSEIVDIAVNAEDFEQFLGAYYCRKMGFPVRKILIACNENSNIWDFVYRGSIHCSASLKNTTYPNQDKVIPDLFEAYLFLAYGYAETQRFLEKAAQKQDYQLPEEMDVPALDDLFVSVIGQERIPTVMSSFHSNNGITVNPYTAFSLGALQDYRAKAGERTLTVVFEEAAP